MENPCTIVCFGDSITLRYASVLEQQIKQKFADVTSKVINAGVSGETSRDGLRRIEEVVEKQPNIVIIGFGMNDCGKEPPNRVPVSEFVRNLVHMIERLRAIGARILLLTLNPLKGVLNNHGNVSVCRYNEAVRSVAQETGARPVDIHAEWLRKIVPHDRGLTDAVHPNPMGVRLYAETIRQILPRPNMIMLWQYNGNPCACNYRCPYCSYLRMQEGNHFEGTIEGWRAAFKRTFPNQHIVFYLAYGEPMIGDRFYEVLDMVGAEPDWEVRMTSNISVPLDKLVNTRIAREGRLNVNASFHPHMTTKDEFLNQALFLREHGIEVPIVYVLYPPLFKRFEDDFRYFDAHRFLVHVRRFRGRYRKKLYPEAYTDEERSFVAKYCDDATIKYMLCNEPTYGKLTWSGVDFILVDNKGTVGYCDDFRQGRHSLGNLFDETVQLLSGPHPFPGRRVSDGTVDGVANLVELGYRQLAGNNVINFSRLGGVYHTPNGVHYKHMETDFNDSRIRAEYRFPARNLQDAWAVLTHEQDSLRTRLRRLASAALPSLVRYDKELTPRALLKRVSSRLLNVPFVAATRRVARVSSDRVSIGGRRLALCLLGDCYARVRGLRGKQFKSFGRHCALQLMRSGEKRWGWRMFQSPVSLFRYAEFDFVLHAAEWGKSPRVLDVGSPRLFAAYLLTHYLDIKLTMTNPDKTDAADSRRFLAACGLNGERVQVSSHVVADLPSEGGSFDTIYSISVLGHVQIEEQQAFLSKLWSLLRPGGRLVLTVPVAASYREEYRDEDVYHLGRERNAAGLVFFQRVYDADALKNQVVQPLAALGGQVVSTRVHGLTGGFKYTDYLERWQQKGRAETVKDVFYASKYLREFEYINDLPERGICCIAFDRK